MSDGYISHLVKGISTVETSSYLLATTKKEIIIDSEDDEYSIDQEEVDEKDASFMIATSDDCIHESFGQM